MSDPYSRAKLLHIVSSTVLFGTGLGTALQMWMAHLSGDPRSIAIVSRNTVIADFLFTTPAIVIQPATGIALVWLSGFDPLASWLVVTYALYALAGACWLPVVWLQIQVRNLALDAVAANRPLPTEYRRYMRFWFALGWPAFIAVLAIFWLMVSKPALWPA
jgi:uncharacterized membrane protein